MSEKPEERATGQPKPTKGEQTFTARDFRDALGGFATGVTIITACNGNGDAIGMTASSFNSVSVEPPLVLWSVTKSSLSAEGFRHAKKFAVHILASNQVALSNRFARSGMDKFSGTGFTMGSDGVPHLPKCTCRFDCDQWAVYEGGDHWIIVGLVRSMERTKAEALVFSGGTYATATPLTTSTTSESDHAKAESPIDGFLLYNMARAYRQLSEGFHKQIRESGLTLSEWRILGSLHGSATRTLPDLAARTFMDKQALIDQVQIMAESDLCIVSDSGDAMTIAGTKTGHDRGAQLFAEGLRLETNALDGIDGGKDQLVALLQHIIGRTNEADASDAR